VPLTAFHPTIASWFAEVLGQPSAPQLQGWPAIARGEHTLIAAPTGSGKTLAAFLVAIDQLLKQRELKQETQVLYVSPLKALSNDVQKNLQAPLAALRARDATLPEVTVQVRTGDTPASERAAMLRTPPHILVTTPESLYLLLTTARGRKQLQTVRTLIVDEIHALARDKRGSHFALTAERLDRLVQQHSGSLQRIGLSATQKPIEDTAALLVGQGRECTIVDAGHRRELDLGLELPGAPLQTVCSTETWSEIFARMAQLVDEHRTTIVFANTRKMTERIAARLAERLGKDRVTSHHGSLSKERRLDAERRLKQGELKALVATASLELGIDIGEVDLVLQVGPTHAIATFLQRVGRAGHALARTPKGRIFPLTRDELVACAGIVYAVRRGDLDRTLQPQAPLDILAQQAIAAACDEEFDEDELFAFVKRAHPFRDLSRERFDAALALHAGSRLSLLHRDPVHKKVRATKRARLVAVTCGGAIPDVADYRVVLDHDDTLVGTVNEDFAIESSIGDVFQLGNASWQVVRIGQGVMRVRDAHGVPPSLPFWLGEAPGRTKELATAVSSVRERGEDRQWLRDECGIDENAAEQIASYLTAGRTALGAMPTVDCLVLERFFDETGGQQLVLHTPFGSRLNRALGLALRKRFCVGFGFELQAAANEEAIVISLGQVHSFPLEDVFSYLHPNTAKDVLIQALLQAPMFETRWRWNASRSLLIERFRKGQRVPAPLLRFFAGDALVAAFPHAEACPETLPQGPIDVPLDHPIVAQTVEDCLVDAMDVDGFLHLLQRMRDGSIRMVAIDTNTPSPFADGILHAMPYAFLDDAPLEERRTQAVVTAQRGGRAQQPADQELDDDAILLVQQEAWPEATTPEQLHEALTWMGWIEDREADGAWRPLLAVLAADGRAIQSGSRWRVAGSREDLVDGWRGRLEAVLPVPVEGLPHDDLTALLQLESEGTAMRARTTRGEVFCHRRLLARVRRYMVERLRRAVEPVSPVDFAAFLLGWQGVHSATQRDGTRRFGPQGLRDALRQLAGTAATVEAWEDEILPQRVHGYSRELLDQLTLAGEFTWLRLWGSWRGPLSKAPLSIVPREDLALWLELPLARPDLAQLGSQATHLHELLAQRGASFPTDLRAWSRMLESQLEDGLSELIGEGLVTCDSFAAARQLAVPPSRRRLPLHAVGRFQLVHWPPAARASEAAVEHAAAALLRRYGVVSQTLLLDERSPLPWRLVLRSLRAMELQGKARGGRFVAGWTGEQFAAPEAVALLRRCREDRMRNEALARQSASD
jgi:ATP-dependent Lhr-like helicase